MSETLLIRATLKGHSGWVTSLATNPLEPELLFSGSRDKTVMIWKLTHDDAYAVPKRSLHGHDHFVQDIAISNSGKYCLSASWDKTLRMWDLSKCDTEARFVGHTNDVLSVSFSPNDRQIVSGSRDKTIKMWNVNGECKFSISKQGHTEWVSCVCFSPNPENPLIVSGGWDRVVKVWDAECRIRTNHFGHTGYINTVTVSPDGSLCASGGKDGIVMLWDLNDGKHLYSLEANDIVHALVFSPNRYWLCAATESGIKIWDLESKKVVDELSPEFDSSSGVARPSCISLAWSADGQTLFSGYTDSNIRVWQVTSA